MVGRQSHAGGPSGIAGKRCFSATRVADDVRELPATAHSARLIFGANPTWAGSHGEGRGASGGEAPVPAPLGPRTNNEIPGAKGREHSTSL